MTRAVHSVSQHEDLRLPAYGGGLFDPDRYPWLEGRPCSRPPQQHSACVDDRTVLRMLRAVQYVVSAGSAGASRSAPSMSNRSATSTKACLELEVRTATEPSSAWSARPWPQRVKQDAEVTLAEMPR